MSIVSSWKEDGSFIPFPRPIDAITTDPLSSQDFGVCLHADWLPAIEGALRVLCRRETWKGPAADVEAAVQGAKDILSHIGDGCTSGFPLIVCCYDFRFAEDALGWSPQSGIVGVTTEDVAGFVGAGWSSVTVEYPTGTFHEVLCINIALPHVSNVFEVSFNYTSIVPVEFGFRGDTGQIPAGLGLGPPGTSEEFAVAEELVGLTVLTVCMSAPTWGAGGPRAAFVLNSICVTLSNSVSACP